MEFLDFIESSSLAIWLRESPSVLAYPTLLAFHTFGMAFLVGTSTAISLRLLGFASSVPLAPLRKFFPVMWLGLSISVVSGALLLMLDARLFLTMPAFFIKLLGVAAALIIMHLLRNRALSDRAGADTGPVPKEAQVLAAAALICWADSNHSGTGDRVFIFYRMAECSRCLDACGCAAGWTLHRGAYAGAKKPA